MILHRFVYAFISLSCPFFFMWLQASLVYSAMILRLDNNERKLSNLPFLTLLTNCFVWVVYGQLEHEMTVFVTNLIGILVGIYCTATYHLYSIYAPNPSHYYISSAVITTSLIGHSLGFHHLVGFLAMISAILVYASPLATLGVVLTEQSTRSMPFPTSVAAFFTAFSWTLYGGIIARDLTILIPSILGVILASAHLLMYVLYGFDTTPAYAHLPQYRYRQFFRCI